MIIWADPASGKSTLAANGPEITLKGEPVKISELFSVTLLDCDTVSYDGIMNSKPTKIRAVAQSFRSNNDVIAFMNVFDLEYAIRGDVVVLPRISKKSWYALFKRFIKRFVRDINDKIVRKDMTDLSKPHWTRVNFDLSQAIIEGNLIPDFDYADKESESFLDYVEKYFKIDNSNEGYAAHFWNYHIWAGTVLHRIQRHISNGVNVIFQDFDKDESLLDVLVNNGIVSLLETVMADPSLSLNDRAAYVSGQPVWIKAINSIQNELEYDAILKVADNLGRAASFTGNDLDDVMEFYV